MTYKTILLHLHDPARADRLLDATMPLVRAMDAHLIGLCVMPPYVVLPGGEVGVATMTVDAHRDAYQADINKLKARFTEVTRLNAARAEWREADANFATASGVIIEHGRVADLVVVSQKDKNWTLSDFLEEPERIAIETGRPVLLVPNTGKPVSPPKRATIAWNGKREAARAVFDALPLLKGTDEVNILWVHPERDQPHAGDIPGAELSATLSRHGIKCVASQTSANDGNIGHELLRQASAFGSDLLVMGAYGHSRMREFVLGGASREMLLQMDRLVLMSH